ncbi:MAG: PD-(D/E)XK nuclease family protein [Patescibacteria group bacterium]
MPDKFAATWVSHSSIKDYLACPRAYFLKNIYKDPRTGRKVQIIAPALTLGQVVHQVLEELSVKSLEDRFKNSLVARFEELWLDVTGKQGGFRSESQELKFKERGRQMLQKVMQNPGPLKQLAVKIKEELPFYWLSPEDEIILCGKIDWLEYLPDTNSVQIIDFKTSLREESSDSLQLPIYLLLVTNTQQRQVSGLSYWYLELADAPQSQTMPDHDQSRGKIMEMAKKIKLARKLNHFNCPAGEGGCPFCQPLEKILRGEAELVGKGGFGRDIYILPGAEEAMMESEVL